MDFLSIAILLSGLLIALGVVVLVVRSLRCYDGEASSSDDFQRLADSSSQSNYEASLYPPHAISLEQGENIRKLARAMLDIENDAAQVCITYAVGQRSGDADACGPGVFYAATLAKMLFDAGITCFCDLMLPPGVARDEISAKLSSRVCKCQIVLVLQTKALYECPYCLNEIFTAFEMELQLMSLRFEDLLPDASAQWANIDSGDTESMRKISTVQAKIAACTCTPSPPYTVIDQPDVLNDVLVDLKARLRLPPYDSACLEEDIFTSQGSAESIVLPSARDESVPTYESSSSTVIGKKKHVSKKDASLQKAASKKDATSLQRAASKKDVSPTRPSSKKTVAFKKDASLQRTQTEAALKSRMGKAGAGSQVTVGKLNSDGTKSAPITLRGVTSGVPDFKTMHEAFEYCRPNKSAMIMDHSLFARVAAKYGGDEQAVTRQHSHLDLDQDGNLAVNFPEFVKWAESKGITLPVGIEGADTGFTFPPTWTGPRDDKTYNERTPVTDGKLLSELQDLLDKTYKNIHTRDRDKTGRKDVPKQFKLVSASKSESYDDWRGYYLKRHFIERQVKSNPNFHEHRPLTAEATDLCSVRHRCRGYANEWMLFHGTNAKAAEAICNNDFTMKLAGLATGSMYGKGIYMAESCTKADEYAQADKNGTCMMLLCRVTGGYVLYDDNTDPDPDNLQNLVLREGYHCVLGDREKVKGTFKEYVVFDADQIFVEYLLSYRRVY